MATATNKRSERRDAAPQTSTFLSFCRYAVAKHAVNTIQENVKLGPGFPPNKRACELPLAASVQGWLVTTGGPKGMESDESRPLTLTARTKPRYFNYTSDKRLLLTPPKKRSFCCRSFFFWRARRLNSVLIQRRMNNSASAR